MSVHNPSQHESGSYRPLQLAPILGIGRSTIYKLLRAGKIRSVKAGRCTLIPADAVTEFLQGPK
ncbi:MULTISPECIES: helix-turn-helix domain-containing protein [Deinococcus]|uniref:Helix-turn-helix domain-containing protein n=1 Tax=Deinococcus rufus TaxID=2136097 RepID=A0ABV7ZCC1_9DEIO|nr:helix-turn-helix domain-containing protein [Deinococcus sp. AB2017081]WQE97454.1 helix-turn-helix domain-containing protein [Deinococcus sp. AB2017081]WQE97477.1 helix-turn-helix domain-containing protein [Deinococcus sp. AB2017081]